MTKASAALVPLKGISFTWALGHTPHSSFTTWAEAEDAILEIIARATETVRIGYKVEWQDGETHQAYFDTRPDMVKARHRERRRYVVGHDPAVPGVYGLPTSIHAVLLKR
jgi:hypothetical protein